MLTLPDSCSDNSFLRYVALFRTIVRKLFKSEYWTPHEVSFKVEIQEELIECYKKPLHMPEISKYGTEIIYYNIMS